MGKKHNHSHCHGHSHSHSHGGDGNIGLAFFLNLAFTFIGLIGGILTNSMAILSDALHDFGDSLTLAFAWYFQKKSKKGSTSKYTYGYKRFSLLGVIITAVILVVGSVYIIVEAIPMLFSPPDANPVGMFILAVLGISIKGIAVLRTRNAASINEKLVSLHLFEDMLGWVAVLIGAVIIYFTGLTIIDPILSIAIAFFILFNVTRLIKHVMPIILQGTPVGIDREEIIEKLANIDQVGDVHDLHIWALDEEHSVLTVHVALKEFMPMERLIGIKEKIRSVLGNENIQHTTIEFEIPGEPCDFRNCV